MTLEADYRVIHIARGGAQAEHLICGGVMKSFFNVRVPAALSTILSIFWLSISLGHAQTPPLEPQPAPQPSPEDAIPVPGFAPLSSFSSGGTEVEPIVEWDKRSNIAQELTAHGLDIMGDNIDPHTGTISFQHTDIDIPGNSALPVRLTRKLTQGYYHKFSVDAEFGDWSYDVPRLHVVTHSDWTGARCSNPTSVFGVESYPNAGGLSGLAYPVEYSSGLMLDAPGSGSQQVLQKSTSITTPFPAAAKHVTADNWYLTCGSASDGGEGFIAKAPNGDSYRFDKYIKYDHINLGAFGPDGANSSAVMPLSRVKVMLMATEVTDVHGNWVRYAYDSSNRLTQIHSNDGRSITLSYSGSSKVIASAATNGRTWTYNYTSTSVSDPFLGDFNAAKKILTSVTRPDSKSWSFSLAYMHMRPYAGTACINNGGTMSLTHPNGAVGTFDISEKNHRNGFAHWRVEASLRCSGGFPAPFGTPDNYDIIHETMDTMSVTRKTITGNDIPTSEWLYSYEEDYPVSRYPVGHAIEGHPIASSSTDPTNWTKVVGPDGVENTFYHYWNIMSGGGPHLHAGTAFGGKLARMEIRSTAGGTIVETRQNDYLQTGTYGGSYIPNNYSLPPISRILSPLSAGTPVEIEKTVVARDGDTFTSESDYNTNQSSSAYSYSLPIATRTFSNVSTTPRQRTTTYEHNATKWILGLPKTISIAGTQVAGYTYNTNGQKTAQTSYSLPWATFGYNADGTMSWFRDALNRQTQAQNWKRGKPQLVVYPDVTSMSQVVDNNGWVTSQTDPKSQTTAYQYDAMGRLTLLNPPGSYFSNTSIAYSFPAYGAVQTITQGNRQTVITHDSMLRPILNHTRDITTTSGQSYVKSTYDVMARPLFTSFPSGSSSPTTGTTISYDALGRTKTQAENVTPFATTSFAYLSSHRTAVTDPASQVTTTWTDGYGGPGEGDVLKIQQPESVTTDMVRNALGNVTSVTQSGGGATTTRNYYYDARQRLCRYVTPEAGHTVYKHDNANQLTHYARGYAAGTGCVTPTGVERVLLTYWPRGGLRATAFSDGVTPDIERTYDANGNLTQVYRGSSGDAVNWDYEYDVMNNLTREKLTTDGRIYDTTYVYNPLSHITKKTLPGGFDINSVPDALGRDKTVQIGSSNLATNAVYHAGGFLSTMNYGNGHAYVLTPDARLKPARIRASKTGTLAFDQQYGYTPRGQISGVTDLADSGNTRSYGYDNLGRLTSASGPWGAGSFTYDALGNLKTKARGTRSVINVYDAPSNRLIRSLDNLALASGGQGDRWIAYDGRGNMQQFGPTWLAYDKNYQMTSSAATTSGTTTSYKYDGNQKRVRLIAATPSAAMASGGGSSESASAFSADVSRLTSAARTSESRSKSSLPPSEVSDILASMLSTATEGRFDRLSDGTAEAMAARARPVYADRARGGFDAYKEVEAKPEKGGAADSLSPALGASTASATASPGCTGPVDKTIFNVYNAAGQLALVDKAHLCKMTLYVRGAGMSLARIEVDTVALTYTRTYLHPDQLGSATAGTSQSGAVLWREQYAPYGDKLTAPAANDDLGSFTGHIDDDATTDMNLTYMQARYYDPGAGRFTSIDPVTFLDTMEPGMVNRYAYTMGDPVNLIDPLGEQGCSVADDNCTASEVSNTVDDLASQLTKENVVNFFDGLITGLGEALESTLSVNPHVEVQVDTSDFVSDSEVNANSPAHIAGSATAAIVGVAGTRGRRVVNSNLAHAAKRAVERAGFGTTKEATVALRGLSKSIRRNGLPNGTLPDPSKVDRLRVPFGTGSAVFQETKSGALRLKTVLPGD
ncbi:hypothetical protein GCM10007853_03940 [Algimonas ampicilliniresistens]|uniref:RHS repeat-associated core domain-containing protein n=1 Tax=Algimonas ampicilliniresistens TaxID=1298735 RepID=A0ABQ5V783_9PROT|nr:RHS repeat-associated core domain-containing protein [Algimonas ampicilliniresistens]GLQ22520.1 hypothetical protein GCM10007853_03940 [Algimonas ampicilliniresistens]